MKTIGIRKFKDHLSGYLRAADAGAVVVITKRGAPGYELRARPEPQSLEQRQKAIGRMLDFLEKDVAEHGPAKPGQRLLTRLLEEERADRV